MKKLFEIEWAGGAAEKHFRKLRPFAAELPWGTLDARKFSREAVDRARLAWTSIAISEYRAAIALARVEHAMLVAQVPLDLIGMAGDFVADETLHVELASRLAMELGGGAPLRVDFESSLREGEGDAFERACDLVLRTGCIHETLSGRIAVETRAIVDHPLVAQIVERIARDESRHTRLGWLYFSWAADVLTDAQRARLATIAIEELERASPLWKKRKRGMTLSELGLLDDATYGQALRETIRDDIVAPLAKVGIVLDRERLDAILR